MTEKRDTEAVEIQTETEVTGGWSFSARLNTGESTRPIKLRLSWADYEYWSGAMVSPARVARAVLEVATETLEAGDLPEAIDASRIRRMIDACDDLMRQKLAGPQ